MTEKEQYVSKIVNALGKFYVPGESNGKSQGGIDIPFTEFPEAQQPTNDYLIPNRPNIDWGTQQPDNVSVTDESYQKPTTRQINGFKVVMGESPSRESVRNPLMEAVDSSPAVSLSGGFQPREVGNWISNDRNPNIDVMQRISAANGIDPTDAFGAKLQTQDAIDTFDPMALDSIKAAERPHLSPKTSTVLDLLDIASGQEVGTGVNRMMAREEAAYKMQNLDKNDRLAQATALAWRASNETDPERKKKYGQAVKRLMPEFAGLDDFTAADFLTEKERRSAEAKQKIEELKVQGKISAEQMKGVFGLQKEAVKGDYGIAKEETKGDYGLQKTDMTNVSHENIAGANNARAIDVANIGYQRGIDVANIGYNRGVDVANIGAGSRENVAGINAGSREAVANINATNRISTTAMRALTGGAGTGKGTAKERAAAAALQYKVDNFDLYNDELNSRVGNLNEALNILKTVPDISGPVAGRKIELGMGDPKELGAYGKVNEILTRDGIMQVIQDLNAAGATSSVFNSESEQERILGMVFNNHAPQVARAQALSILIDRIKVKQSRENEYLRRMGANTTGTQAAKSPVSTQKTTTMKQESTGGLSWE